MVEREEGFPKPKVVSRREFLTLLVGVGEAVIGYTSYRTDSLAPDIAKAVTMSGVMTPVGLLVGRAVGSRSIIYSLLFGHVSGATTLLFKPPQKFKDR